MRIQPTQPVQMNARPKITKVYDWGKISEKWTLDNGNKLQVNTYFGIDGEIENKLFYLTDKAGKWIKSVLNTYEGGKKIKQTKSYAK